MDEKVWSNWLLINAVLLIFGWVAAYIHRWRKERRDLGLSAGFSDLAEHAVSVLAISLMVAVFVTFVCYLIIFKKGSKNAEHK